MAQDVYSCELLGVIAGQPCANVLHFNSSEESGENPVQAAKELITALGSPAAAGSFLADYVKCLPENYFLKGVRARRINNTGGPKVSRPFDSDPGERPGLADVSGFGPVGLYHAQEADMKWVTGKVFFPGCSISDVAANVFSTALVDACTTFLEHVEDVLGAAPIGPFGQVVWSPSTSTMLLVVDWSVSAKVGTQRRRYVPL